MSGGDLETDLLSEIIKTALELGKDKKSEQEFIQTILQYREVVGEIPCKIKKRKRKPGRPRKGEKHANKKEYQIQKEIPNQKCQDLLSFMFEQKGNGSGPVINKFKHKDRED